MKKVMLFIVKGLGILISAVILCIIIILLVSFVRPNGSDVSEKLSPETWIAVHDKKHNSNTDMIFFDNAYWLVHASAPWHFASDKTRLILLKSYDAKTWEKTAEFSNPGQDIRDPKLVVIGDKMFLYALKNKEFAAEPYLTVVSASTDGKTWTPFKDIEPKGWLFWRPESPDGGITWYVPAYWHEHGKSILLKSTNGFDWEISSIVYSGDVNDETAMVFLPDGRVMVTARLEVSGYYFGDNRGNTLIATAPSPYVVWTYNHSTVTRLDGPALFTFNGRVYAVGRYQPHTMSGLFETGSILARKRTSLFFVEENRLTWLSDLPSDGDTSYAGVVVKDTTLLVSYYTSNVRHDYPWVIGMMLPSDIMIAKIDLTKLEALAVEKTAGKNQQ